MKTQSTMAAVGILGLSIGLGAGQLNKPSKTFEVVGFGCHRTAKMCAVYIEEKIGTEKRERQAQFFFDGRSRDESGRKLTGPAPAEIAVFMEAFKAKKLDPVLSLLP